MQPMVRKAGGGIVNPNPSPTAVEVRPPCTIYNSGVWSGVCVCLAGIRWRCCGIAFYERVSGWEEHNVVLVFTVTVLTASSKRGACVTPTGSAALSLPFRKLVPHWIPAKSHLESVGWKTCRHGWAQQGGKTRRGNSCPAFLPRYVNQQ